MFVVCRRMMEVNEIWERIVGFHCVMMLFLDLPVSLFRLDDDEDPVN
jgi:hypothetical protein